MQVPVGDEEASLWARKSSELNPKKGLRASKLLSHAAWARTKESKAVKMGRKGAMGEERALLAGVTLDVSFIPAASWSDGPFACKTEGEAIATLLPS